MTLQRFVFARLLRLVPVVGKTIVQCSAPGEMTHDQHPYSDEVPCESEPATLTSLL